MLTKRDAELDIVTLRMGHAVTEVKAVSFSDDLRQLAQQIAGWAKAVRKEPTKKSIPPNSWIDQAV